MTQNHGRGLRVPVNLIAGPLGVGKTTAIRHLLETRPAGERWAVLVNEFGLVGLDAALLADAAEPDGIDVRELAGGCICCSAGFLFELALAALLEERPDRLLIEPTGLAALSGILDSLDRDHIRDKVDVRSTICLLDPATFAQDLQREEVDDQVEAADLLLANRSDLASERQLEEFTVWAESLFPRRAHVGHVERGRIDVELLDLVADRRVAVRRGDYGHGTDHQHEQSGHGPEVEAEEATQPIERRCHISPVTSTIGWICHSDLVFEAEPVLRLLAELARLPGAQRVKAVLHTDDGWWNFNFTARVRDARPTSYRRDSRIEAVVEGDDLPDLDTLEQALHESVVSSRQVGRDGREQDAPR